VNWVAQSTLIKFMLARRIGRGRKGRQEGMLKPQPPGAKPIADDLTVAMKHIIDRATYLVPLPDSYAHIAWRAAMSSC
jgi:hypothetical protein